MERIISLRFKLRLLSCAPHEPMHNSAAALPPSLPRHDAASSFLIAADSVSH